MQTPVRYYITQSDDRAVVRSVPVTAPRFAAAEETLMVATDQPGVPELDRAERGRMRVTRLMRAATRRAAGTR